MKSRHVLFRIVCATALLATASCAHEPARRRAEEPGSRLDAIPVPQQAGNTLASRYRSIERLAIPVVLLETTRQNGDVTKFTRTLTRYLAKELADSPALKVEYPLNAAVYEILDVATPHQLDDGRLSVILAETGARAVLMPSFDPATGTMSIAGFDKEGRFPVASGPVMEPEGTDVVITAYREPKPLQFARVKVYLLAAPNVVERTEKRPERGAPKREPDAPVAPPAPAPGTTPNLSGMDLSKLMTSMQGIGGINPQAMNQVADMLRGGTVSAPTPPPVTASVPAAEGGGADFTSSRSDMTAGEVTLMLNGRKLVDRDMLGSLPEQESGKGKDNGILLYDAKVAAGSAIGLDMSFASFVARRRFKGDYTLRTKPNHVHRVQVYYDAAAGVRFVDFDREKPMQVQLRESPGDASPDEAITEEEFGWTAP